MRSWLRAGLVVAVVAGGVGAALAQNGLTKEDRRGTVTVTVTLAAPPVDVTPIRVTVVLDTHSAVLDAIKFEEVVAMRSPEGIDIKPTVVAEKGGVHHREAVLIFPPIAQSGTVRIVVRNVGGIAERVFSWSCPTLC